MKLRKRLLLQDETDIYIYIYIDIDIEKGQFNKLTTMAGRSNIAEPMMMMIKSGLEVTWWKLQEADVWISAVRF